MTRTARMKEIKKRLITASRGVKQLRR